MRWKAATTVVKLNKTKERENAIYNFPRVYIELFELDSTLRASVKKNIILCYMYVRDLSLSKLNLVEENIVFE